MTLSNYCQTIQLAREDKDYLAHLCIANGLLQDLASHANHFLHPLEKLTYSELSFERRQHSYLLGRYCAKRALNNFIHTDLKSIYIEAGVFDFPVTHIPIENKWQVSISHCDSLCCTIAFPETHPMGIDIEKVNESNIEFLSSHITEKDRRIICELNIADDKAYTLIWTVKEALSKVLRCGLTSPFDIFDIKQVDSNNTYWFSEFINFPQYKAITFQLSNSVLASIVYPRLTTLHIDIQHIQQWVEHHLNQPFKQEPRGLING